MTRPPGSAIGRYQILSFMARGETSLIYKALEPELGREVALKILPPSAARDPRQVERWLRLAERLAKLDHEALLPILDYGREDGVPFVVLPIAPGGNLQDNLDAYRDPQRALSLVVTLAQATDFLHQNQIVHGRIGPQHVLLDAQGEPLLTGYGQSPDASQHPTLVYMAPEQRQGKAPDERTDIYQLGALLYHLLLGEPPDPDADLPANLQSAGLDDGVTAALSQALALEPDDRFDTAADFAAQLALDTQRQAAPEPVAEPPPETPSVEAATEAEETLETAAPEYASPGLFNDNPVWLAAALAGLAILLALCCLLAVFAVYTVSGRMRQPLATAQVDTNVRAGPTIEYEIVGILREGEQAGIVGVSPDGRWWQITFDAGPDGKGWVPAVFVTVDRMGNVEVVEPPPLEREATLPQTTLGMLLASTRPRSMH